MATAFNGSLAPNSEKSYDVLADTRRLQVKARVVSDPPRSGQLQLSPFRSFDFDEAVIVLLNDTDYAVQRAVRIPSQVVRDAATYNAHVNGHIVHARPALLDGPTSEDVTSLLRTVA